MNLFAFIDNFLLRLSSEQECFLPFDEIKNIVKAKFDSNSQNCKKILFIGGVESPTIEQTVCDIWDGEHKLVEEFSEDENSIQFCAGGNLLSNYKAIGLLQLCDGVVIIEKKNISRFSDIEATILAVERHHKPIIGAILI